MHTMMTLAASNWAASTTKKGGSSPYSLLILVGLFAVGYFVLIRPARNRQRNAVATTRGNCDVGDEVTTTAGLLATVVAIDDEEGVVTLEVAPGVHSRFLRTAIVKVNYPPEDDSDDVLTGEHEAIDPPVEDHHDEVDPEPVVPDPISPTDDPPFAQHPADAPDDRPTA